MERALEAIKAPYILSKNPKDLENVDRLIFPGVGDAAYAMEQLKLTGFDVFLKDWVAAEKPLIGICLGSQIIFDYSEEGDTECLGFIPGEIRHFSGLWSKRNPDAEEIMQGALEPGNLKIPHMGWNNLTFCNGGSKLLDGVKESSDFYFVHSYVIQPKDPTVIKAYANYGMMVPAVVEKGCVTAFQFHPEKSGEPGLRILKNYVGADFNK